MPFIYPSLFDVTVVCRKAFALATWMFPEGVAFMPSRR